MIISQSYMVYRRTDPYASEVTTVPLPIGIAGTNSPIISGLINQCTRAFLQIGSSFPDGLSLEVLVSRQPTRRVTVRAPAILDAPK